MVADGEDDGVDGVREGVGAFDMHVVPAGENPLGGVRAEFDEFFLEREALLFEHGGGNVEIIVVAAFRARENKKRPRA